MKRTLLIFLAILSLFNSSAINGNWYHSYLYSYVDGWEVFLIGLRQRPMDWFDILHWPITVISHTLILLFPFIYQWLRNFNKWLLYVPLIFITTQVLIMAIFAIVMIPFVTFWIAIMIYGKYENA